MLVVSPVIQSAMSNDSQIENPGSSFVLEEVLRAEILWCHHIVMNHLSYRSANNVSQLLSTMFTADPTALAFSMAKDEASYLINFGIFPFYSAKLLDTVQSLLFYTVLFDESFNEVLNKSQMDIMVRYFDINDGKVKNRYV